MPIYFWRVHRLRRPMLWGILITCSGERPQHKNKSKLTEMECMMMNMKKYFEDFGLLCYGMNMRNSGYCVDQEMVRRLRDLH